MGLCPLEVKSLLKMGRGYFLEPTYTFTFILPLRADLLLCHMATVAVLVETGREGCFALALLKVFQNLFLLS